MALNSFNLNKVLLPAVALIWLLLGLRFMGFFDPKDERALQDQQYQLAQNIELDTFSLLGDYPDPFLGDLPEIDKKRPKRKIGSGAKLIPVKLKTPIKIPNLQYQGLVQKDSADATAILMVDNKLISIRAGQNIGALFIKSISPSRVEIAIEDTLISILR